MAITAIYPGTFDPITIGHLDIMQRSLTIVDKLIVAVAENTPKEPMFDFNKRIDLVQRAAVCITDEDIDEGCIGESCGKVDRGCKVKNYGKVEVISFKGLLIDFAKEQKVNLIIRGIRNPTDFDYEFGMAGMNHKMDNCIDTIFLPTYESTQFIIAKLIREITSAGGDISDFIPCCLKEEVEKYLATKK
jgi:pantetheine-phosphate adenylyltransferase